MMRYREGSKMGSVMTDLCGRCQQTPKSPEFAYPIRLHKVGSPCHFSAVAAYSGSTLRTLNAAVTKNSTAMGRGFYYWRRIERMRAPTSLPAAPGSDLSASAYRLQIAL
jgi:hypothetical protein